MLLITAFFVAVEAIAPMLATTGEMTEAAEAEKTLNGRVIDDSLLQEMYPKLVANGREWNKINYNLIYFNLINNFNKEESKRKIKIF